MAGHIYTIEELRNYFLTGSKPTEEQFYRFIRECYNNDDEVIAELKLWTNGEISQLRTWVQSEIDNIQSALRALSGDMGETFQSSFNIGSINVGDTIESTEKVQGVIKRILYKVLTAEVESEPTAKLTTSKPFGTYEVGSAFEIELSVEYTDGKLLTWNGVTSGITDAGCSIALHEPEYYINGIRSDSYKPTISIEIPSSVNGNSEVKVYGEQLYDASTVQATNSDGSINSEAVIESGKCQTETGVYTGAFRFFSGFIRRNELDTLATSSSIRNLTRFTGFLDPEGTNITAEDERYVSQSDGSEFYIVAAVPVGYIVKIDNESFMDTTLKQRETPVSVYLGEGKSTETQAYNVWYAPCNGAAIRNLYTYHKE